VHVEFGIVALAHNLLKAAGIRLAAFSQKSKDKKNLRKNTVFFLRFFTIRDLSDIPFFKKLILKNKDLTKFSQKPPSSSVKR
jgi:hypothetical protein